MMCGHYRKAGIGDMLGTLRYVVYSHFAKIDMLRHRSIGIHLFMNAYVRPLVDGDTVKSATMRMLRNGGLKLQP